MKILAYEYNFQYLDLSKDAFLIPYYITKALKGNLEFVYCKNMGNSEVPKLHRGAKTTKSLYKNDALTMLRYIAFRAKQFDLLYMIGCSLKHMIIVWLYLHLNTKGKVLILGDMEPTQAREFNNSDFMCPPGIKGIIKGYFTNYFMKNVTYIVANTESYEEMGKLCKRHNWKGLLHFYPCIDDEKINEYGIVRNTWEQKENIIITVGRIGNYQKNTDMLLSALKNVDLLEWKILMIGPITSSFNLNEEGDYRKKIDQFYMDYPHFRDKLIFTGMISDQHVVFDYYNRAKVLLSTSRHEGFANIYSQAAAFGCYIISTDVGGADVGSNRWTYGSKINQEDSDELADVLNSLVNNKLIINQDNAISLKDISYSHMVNKILLPKLGYEATPDI